MATSKGQESFTFEEKLANLNLTATERAKALGALRTAESFVDFVQLCGAGIRRVAEFLSLKPSLKH